VHRESLDGDRLFLIHDFFTADECQSAVDRSERAGYEAATVTTAEGAVRIAEIRDNARLIEEDRALAETLWTRARQFLPPTVDSWRGIGLNERFRFYRYDPGQKFAPHFDGYFERDNGERSQLTFMVYLNDDFAGGETKFYGADRDRAVERVTVRPVRGMALVFAHLQLHEGASVVQGRKYVLRTDVMYTLGVAADGR
jgi:predicted 2-oxoglutarate/Fe(II)-dependent dioxygenase YbiX